MSNSAIAIRYAKALLSIGKEVGQVEPYAEELSSVAAVMSKQDLLRLLLDSPTLPVEKKSAIMNDVVDLMKLSEGMKDFLGLLVVKGRIAQVPQISENYRRFADELSGIVRATLTSAHSLSDQTNEAIRAGLEKQTGKKVVLNLAVDQSLIGGVKAEMGGKLFDGSVKTQLKQIADTLAKG
ncbi:ATP synthase F1 subunit delta [Geopsychrobacter electrodiphilus]|uniref:ATP synthase F1 subunit delta n=1 Tax=Geopsychrobacter electrodiphilus TaxID=225196 RepID=UPI000377D6EB|nr:ATP synthase F1 subunit delta [Geopsychrobacter electrodiphilus]